MEIYSPKQKNPELFKNNKVMGSKNLIKPEVEIPQIIFEPTPADSINVSNSLLAKIKNFMSKKVMVFLQLDETENIK